MTTPSHAHNDPEDALLQELDELLFDWDAGTLNDAGIIRVREILKNSDAAQTHFAKSQLLSATLHMESQASLTLGDTEFEEHDNDKARQPVGLATSTPAASATGRWSTRNRLALAGLLIAVITIGALMTRPPAEQAKTETPTNNRAATTDRPRSQEEATAQGVAVLTRLIDVDWNGKPAFEVGDAIPAGRLSIPSGFAQVEFFCGATIVLEGPAELELTSSTTARIHHGRLRAQVPPAAIGFTIETSDMKVVDLGTEFGISVSERGSDVHVFDGEIELHHHEDSNALRRMLAAGQAMSRTANGDWEPSEPKVEKFVGIQGLESQEIDQQQKRFRNWKNGSEELRRNPRLIAYYAFDDKGGWQRRLKSDKPDSPELDGAIVGAGRLPGRWRDKGALEFKRPGDRVRVNIPGEFDSLTFACWTKIDSLDRWYNSLFLTDGFEQGEPHWQILDTGQLFFSTRYTKTKCNVNHQPILSAPFWDPSVSGKWIHLATTYNVENRQVTHYLNGKVIGQDTVPANLAVKTTRIGKASIGNWAEPIRPDASYAIRNLNGSIDELAIFSAALSGEEIQEIYEYGKP